MLNQKVKFSYVENEKTRNATITVYGRTAEELAERVEKTIWAKTAKHSWKLR